LSGIKAVGRLPGNAKYSMSVLAVTLSISGEELQMIWCFLVSASAMTLYWLTSRLYMQPAEANSLAEHLSGTSG